MKTIPYTEKDFNWVKWTPKQIEKIGENLLVNLKHDYEVMKEVLPEERTFLNTVVAIETAGGEFSDMFNKVAFLMDVSPKAPIREIAHKVVTEVSEKSIDIEYDRDIYISLREYVEGNYLDDKKKLRREDIRLIELMLCDYKKMGFDLPDKEYVKLKKLIKKLSNLQISFSHNINNYHDEILCIKEELDGMSDRYISLLPYDSKTKKYTVTLAYPHLHPFLAQATNRNKRKELADKAGKRGGKKNLVIFNKIIELRHEIATLLGYAHHADLKTDGRTAKNAQTVNDFHSAILKKVEARAKKDIQMIQAHGKKLGIENVDNQDWSFVINSLKKELLDLDPEDTRAYFPYEHVFTVLTDLVKKLFGITFIKLPHQMWEKSVPVYELVDKDKSVVGYLAIDLYPREGKYGHAAMFDFQYGREKVYGGDEYSPAFGAIVANYPMPNKNNPSLMSTWEVEALFHEMGHSLHLILSKVPHKSISGTSVAWDFVETPSQIMENWVYQDEVLKKLTKHYKTGKVMPEEMRKKIIESNTFLQSMGYLDQIFMGELDIEMHSGKKFDINKKYRDFKKEMYGFNLSAENYLFPAGFGHLGGGYDAAYYSYLWSLVLAQDAFSEFKKAMSEDSKVGTCPAKHTCEVGLKWRREVLEKGSSDDEMKLLANFLGRKTNQKAFLKELSS